jgi:DUF1680 family protein
MLRCALVLSLIAFTTASAARAADAVAPVVPAPAREFGPGAVKLLDGPYRRALELDGKFLLGLDVDRLVAPFRTQAGLEEKAKAYGGWEGRGIAGHSLGHYLSACARMYGATGDEEFRQRVARAVEQLDQCQQAAGDGFVGGMPEARRIFGEVSRGEIRSQGFDLNGSWVPWYNQHKLFAGLIDAYQFCGNEQAKAVAVRLGDWAIATTKDLSDDQWQRMLACEHGGMNETLADLYAITGNGAYLELGKKFYHRAILDPLADGRDELGGKHANTQIPKIIGAARIYELTGDQKFADVARFFWETVVAHHTYVTGGNSQDEHFGPPGRLNDRLGVNTTESCNTYNMLKLTAKLFELEPRGEYAEYMERALWNHILPSRHPESGRVTYFLTLKPGEKRRYTGELEFTCCNGSGMENPPRTADYIYFHGDGELWVNQFIASEVAWDGFTVRQETQFPNEPRTTITFAGGEPKRFTLRLRHPKWIAGALAMTLNGEPVKAVSTPGGFAAIDREWADGDTLTVELPLSLHTESMPDNAQRVAVFDGPILLAGDLSGDDQRRVPAIVNDDRPVDEWVKPAGGGGAADLYGTKLHFALQGVGRPRDVSLLPFYAAHDMPATAYWDTFDQAQWQRREAEREAERQREAELAARTVDVLAVGEMQPERDHDVKGERTEAGEWSGRKFRHAWDGGWFSCELKTPGDGPAELLVDYWGSETGAREFDVQVDGVTIATTSLHMDAPDQFWQQAYPLPAELMAGKKTVTVRFQAKPGNYAGGVFGLRLVRAR